MKISEIVQENVQICGKIAVNSIVRVVHTGSSLCWIFLLENIRPVADNCVAPGKVKMKVLCQYGQTGGDK